MAAHLSSMSSESQHTPALLTTLSVLLKMQVESYKPPV